MFGKPSRRALIAAPTAVLAVAAMSLAPELGSSAAASGPRYLNRHASPTARAADLVHRMTLDQQIGQMTQIEVDKIVGDCNYGPGSLNQACAKKVLGDDAVGSILSGGGSPPTEDQAKNSPKDWANAINAIVKYSIKHNPLHIPVIYGADVVHGHSNVVGDTLFPQEIGFGASWDPGLVTAAQESAARAADATNVRWAFSPVSGVDTDTRWGRYYESFSEDTTLAGTLAAASVRGLQHSGSVAASVKHFAGYPASDNGLDRTNADASLRYLQDDQLPAYGAAVRAGAQTVMADSGAVNGVPVTGSHYLLSTVLRHRMHFDGVVVSDWADIAALQTKYHVASDYEHAAAIAINAGVDMAMEPFDADSFEGAVKSAVEDHLISRRRIAQAAQRVLALKFRTGVFDHPYVNASKANQTLGADKGLARKAAAESTVLLRNSGNALPLNSGEHVTVTGPSADSVADTLGGWSIGWQGVPDGSKEKAVTVLQGLKNAGGDNVTYAKTKQDAVKAASDTDAYVVAVGNGPGAEGPNDKRDPVLPADQQAWVQALVNTGKPVILVMVAGRPLALGSLVNDKGDIAPQGLVMAWRPGSEGGNGVADVLYGKVNPSGRLPVSWPRRASDEPNSYRKLTLPSTYNGNGSVYQPLYPFGAGQSYTSYDFGTVAAHRHHGQVTVRVAVSNTGKRAGTEVVPVYVSQPVSRVLVPSKRLVGFTRVSLKPGEHRAVSVRVPTSRLEVTGGDINGTRKVLEHGTYVFSTGSFDSKLPTGDGASLTF